MTAQNRVTNKAKFEQGDTPQGADYVDLIDSYVSLADTTAQSVSSPLVVSGAVGASTTVSAQSIEAQTIAASGASFTGSISVVGAVSANTVAASAASFTHMSAANVSANALGITGSLTWTAEVTASVISTGQQTIDGLVVNKFLIVTVSGQTVGIPCFKVS